MPMTRGEAPRRCASSRPRLCRREAPCAHPERGIAWGMANPTAAEAAQHLETAIAEAQRLAEHFSQRSKDEKRRMSQLQQLVPKLKRLAKSQAIEKPLSAEEQKVLESLKPPPKS